MKKKKREEIREKTSPSSLIHSIVSASGSGSSSGGGGGGTTTAAERCRLENPNLSLIITTTTTTTLVYKTSTAIKDIFSLLSFFWSPETGQSSSHPPPLEQHLCVKKCRCGSFQAARIFMVTTQHTCSVLFCSVMMFSSLSLVSTHKHIHEIERTHL